MKLNKIEKVLSKEAMNELEGLAKEGVQEAIAQAEEAMDKARRERDALPAYQSAKLAVKDLSEALKEVRKYQCAKIAYCLILLREFNGETVDE